MTRKRKQAAIPAEWIDEIPTQASTFKARVVSFAALMLVGLGAGAWAFGPGAWFAFLDVNPEIASLLAQRGQSTALLVCWPLFGALGAVCGLAGLFGLWRRPFTYRLLRSALAVVYPLVAIYAVLTWHALFAVLAADLKIGGADQDRATILLFWWRVSWPALAVAFYVAWLHVMLRSRSVYAAFTSDAGAPMDGDRLLEDVRTHGHDPRARRSLYRSALTHLIILVVIPYLLNAGGCVTPHRVPKGSGTPTVNVEMKVVKKKKKRKRLSLRPNSAIIFEVPDLDDTEVDQQMEEQTQATYQVAKKGKLGKGGGTKGGWPEGMDDYKIRFMRLDHGGSGWDDGMNQTGADVNFLRAFAQATGFTRIAHKGESHSIALLKKYPKDGFPPFVYLTGNGHMGRVSSSDIKILREYCLKGGMLVADAGSYAFHQSFHHFITRQVFPDKQLLDIADDDMLYQLPFGFPNGAPAFWHHGGRRALGIKHEGRWCVFYHPGDMNDAWKSQGYTDVTPEMRAAAMNLGINIVYYAFNQWDDAVAKLRK